MFLSTESTQALIFICPNWNHCEAIINQKLAYLRPYHPECLTIDYSTQLETLNVIAFLFIVSQQFIVVSLQAPSNHYFQLFIALTNGLL